jgi:nitrous oxide reductase accessory protein NosL
MTIRLKPFAAIIIGFHLATVTALHAGNPMPAPSSKDKCAVCGMFVIHYQNWISSIRLKKGSIAYFDGPKDMFTYYLNLEKYAPAAKKSEITEVFVKDYYSVKPIDARKAYFVTGSDVSGPMGKELVPFFSQSDAQAFKTDHKGNRIYRFNEITSETLSGLQ